MKCYIKRFVEKHSQTVGERTEVDEMMALIFIIQNTFRYHVLDPKWNWGKYFIYHLLNIALMIYVFFGTIEILNHTSNFQMKAEAIFTLIVMLASPLRILTLAYNRFIYRKLYLTTKTTFYNLINGDSENKVKEVLQTGTKVIYATFCLMTIPIVQMMSLALWNYVKGTRILLSRSTSILMPMTSPYYEIAFVFHSIFLFQVGSLITTSDLCFVFLTYFLCVAHDALLKTLHVEPKRPDESNGSYEERLNDNLKKFYLAYLEILKFESALNQMYKWMALVPLCNSALCLCISLLVVSKEVNWHFGTIIVQIFFDILIYCWFGEQLKKKASNIEVALLNYDWTSMKLEDKKNYYILILFMNKDFGLRTAIGLDLSLITMSSVFQFSYELFTVLKTVE